MKRLLPLLFGTALMFAGCQSAQPSGQPAEDKTTEAPDQVASVSSSKPMTSLSISDRSLEATKVIKDERTGIVPATLEIPAIDVKAPVEGYGILENGEMAVPNSIVTTGWYKDGYKPGEAGNAVIAGHVDGRNGPAVFYDIGKLKKGDEIIVKDDKGETRVFEVVSKESYPFDQSPLREIFGFSYGSYLNLITCTGDYNKKAKRYEERLVVSAALKK